MQGKLLIIIIQLYIIIDVTQMLYSNRSLLVLAKLKRLQYHLRKSLEEAKFSDQVKTKLGWLPKGFMCKPSKVNYQRG